MNELASYLWVIAAVIAVAGVGYVVSLFNSLVQVRNNLRKAWGNIDVLLLQRNEEVAKLVDIGCAFRAYEQDLLESIVQLRSRYREADERDVKVSVENEFSKLIAVLRGTGEAHPEVASSALFLSIQERLSELEGALADRRTFYNASVKIHNEQIERFPQLVFAHLLGLRRHSYLSTSKGVADRKVVCNSE
jgi:LemA protein